MQLLNHLKQNASTIKCLLFWGSILLNLIVFINLNEQKSKLAIEVENLQRREYAVSNREETCSKYEQFLLIKEDLVDISVDIIDKKIAELDDYNDYLQEKTENVNSQINLMNEQFDSLSLLAKKIHSAENVYIPTPEEIDTLNKLVFAEAGNQSYEGKVAVAEVVFNRIESPVFPDSIKDVIFEKHQFSPCYDGKSVRLGNGKEVSNEIISDEIKQSVLEAWYGSNLTEDLLRKEANKKGIYDSSFWEGGALYFANPNIVKNYSSSSAVKVNIQDHCFKRK